jgi:RimJ/RimL family protein N-acetyltransferase
VTAGVPREPFRLPAGDVVLRGTRSADAPDALEMFEDVEMARWYSGPAPLELSRVEEWCRSSSDWSSGEHATWAIADAGDTMVGNLSLVRIDLSEGTAGIAYRVAARARGRGVATLAVSAATGWAFEALGLARIELEHAVANPASCRVAERSGYLLEGTKRASYRDDDGRRWDCHLHARLALDPPGAGLSQSGS